MYLFIIIILHIVYSIGLIYVVHFTYSCFTNVVFYAYKWKYILEIWRFINEIVIIRNILI